MFFGRGQTESRLFEGLEVCFFDLLEKRFGGGLAVEEGGREGGKERRREGRRGGEKDGGKKGGREGGKEGRRIRCVVTQ